MHNDLGEFSVSVSLWGTESSISFEILERPYVTAIEGKYALEPIVDDKFQKDQLEIVAVYSDSTKQPITDFIVDYEDTFSKTGNIEIPIRWTDSKGNVFETKIAITVIPQLISLNVTYLGAAVPVGTTINSDKIKVIGNYSDGSTKDIDSFEIIHNTVALVGDNTVDISYGTIKTSFVVVGIGLTSISAEYKGTSVMIDDSINISDIECTAYYSDGTKRIVTTFSITPSTIKKLGENSITVSYEGKTTNIIVIGVDKTYNTPTPTNIPTPTNTPVPTKVPEHTVSFDPTGGTVSKKTTTVKVGASYGTLPTAERTGYSFDGWFTEKTGGVQIKGDTTVTITEGETLYAHWTAKKYTILFNGNGGTASTASISVAFDETYGTLSTAIRTGYDFVGWFTEKNGGSQIKSNTKVTVTREQTLYAHWTAKSYTVSFDGNGGTPSTVSTNVTYDKEYGTVPTATRTGYDFTGWFTAKTGGTEIKSDTKVTITAGQTLYAHWTVKSYKVSYTEIGTGYTIKVERTASPNGKANTGIVKSGAKIYYDDELRITYEPKQGYSLLSQGDTSVKVNSNVTESNIYATAAFILNFYAHKTGYDNGAIIEFMWYEVPNAVGYELQYKQSDSRLNMFSDWKTETDYSGTGCYLQTGGYYNANYSFRLRAKYSDGGVSEWVEITLDCSGYFGPSNNNGNNLLTTLR
jgi:uncharacterized repeat protein (TIGR02543 family)